MPANVQILSYHGGTTGSPGTSPDVKGTNVRHKRADDDTADLNSAVAIPSTGVAYSWRKHTKLNFATAPASQASNLRWYLGNLPVSGDPAKDWTGVSIYAGVTATYSKGGTPGSDGRNDETTKLPWLSDADLIPYDTSNPLVVVSGVFQVTSTGVGLTQPFVCHQMGVGPTAINGEKTARDTFYRWDEI